MLIRNKFAVLFLALLMFACAPKADTSDPEYVANAFWTAVQNGDAAQAAMYIHSDSRDELAKMIKQDIRNGMVPLLPEKLTFEMKIDGNKAIAKIADSDGVACDLMKENGRWWVR